LLRWRLATALILLPVIAGVIAAGRWVILAALVVVAVIAAYEVSQALPPFPFSAGVVAGLGPVVLSGPFGVSGALGGSLLVLPVTLAILLERRGARTPLVLLAGFMMALWVGVPLAYVGLLAGLPHGRLLVVLLLVGSWASDSGAYFTGLLVGRRLLAPEVSPKKTVEGAVGGLVAATVLVGVGASHFLGLGLWQSFVAGGVISVFGQAGDLFESSVKRILGIKDLGRLLPGHGGMLDRVDSLLFAAPVLYYLVVLAS